MDQPVMSIEEPPKKSSSYLKWGLIGCGGLLALAAIVAGVLFYLVFNRMTMDPQGVEAVAQQILRFEKPEGFKGIWSMSMMGVKLAVLGHPEGSDPREEMIVLMEFPGSANSEEMRNRFREAMKNQGQADDEEVAEQRPSETFMVQGAETEARVTLLGGRAGGRKSLQYMLTLQSVSGKPALVVINGPEDVITHEWVQNFLNSVQ
ncbi:MAG TPA: hypothetical protein VFY29_19025 [Terriglobia bacterium]|nr:hypothetical protein [Terriglobia bacterium]